MPWEKPSKNAALYYRRHKRRNGRLEKEYFGNGAEALLACAEDELQREARLERRRAIQARIDELRMLSHRDSAPMDGATMAGALLFAEGLHYHRGEWRT